MVESSEIACSSSSLINVRDKMKANCADGLRNEVCDAQNVKQKAKREISFGWPYSNAYST